MTPGPTRVLHVVECYGGGVASALDQYVRATPELSHHLLRRFRDDFAEDGQSDAFDTVEELPPGHLRARTAVRRRVQQLEPAVVHAHSSFAGLYVRTSLRRGRPRLVYTAHGYGFERRDVSPLHRRAYFLAERLLGANTDAYAPCSERELALSRAVAPRRPRVLLVNAVDKAETLAGPTPHDRSTIVGIGRLGPSKDPEFFGRTLDELRTLLGPVEATWIGDGPPEHVAPLVARGVEVTGWVPRSQAFQRLAAATAYVNTSAWESGPMALLEAQALGVPIVARRLPTFRACPADYLADTPADLAARLARTLGSPEERTRNLEAWSRCFAANTPQGQQAALLSAYGLETDEEAGACLGSRTA